MEKYGRLIEKAMRSQMHEEVPSDCEEWRTKTKKGNQSKASSTPSTTSSKSKASSTSLTTSSKSKASSTPLTTSSKSKSSDKQQKHSNYMTLLK